jgi:hypothetical protein
MNICYCLLSALQNQLKTEKRSLIGGQLFFVVPIRDLFSQLKKKKKNIRTSKFEISSN